MEYRTRFHNVADILAIANEPSAKTRVMLRSGLNLRQWKDYLKTLEEKGLLKETADGQVVATEKGKALRLKIEEVVKEFDEQPAAPAKKKSAKAQTAS